MHSDYHTQPRERVEKQLESGKPVPPEEVVLIRLDGTAILCEAAASPFVYKGKPAVQVVVRDISERRQIEVELQKLAEVVKHSKDLINMATLEGNMIFLNEAGGEMLGIDPQACQSVNIMHVIPEHLVALVENELVPALLRGEIWEGDLQYLNLQSGDLTDVHATTFSVKNPETGEPWFLANVSQDISERKKAEENRLNLERKILHAQKLESLGILAGGIAHDFNNLLMGVIGQADLALLNLNPESPARSNVLDIQSAGIRLAELTKQMLAYSGKAELSIAPLDLSRLVEELAHLLQVSIHKKVVLKYELSKNQPRFRGDASQIQQVVMNLITNASEACMEKDGGVVSLRTGVRNLDSSAPEKYVLENTLEGDYVFLEVSDVGCGMDQGTQDRIFEPFFTTKFTGRGLGLASVLGIIKSHTGNIRISSQPNQGTTMTVLFPVAPLETSDLTEEQKHQPAWRSHGQILLVDDEPTVLKVGQEMLKHLGFSVITANSGQAALKLLQQHTFELDCVLLDLTMPGMDGQQTLAEIRRVRKDLPIVLCSGYAQQQALKDFKLNDDTGFLQKPFRLQILQDKLNEMLG